MGNIVNRVFDSAGPEGKVRGTPQQIIEKYQSLARDAQLSNDRVAAENFSQHSEHYSRMLGEALSQQAEMRQSNEGQGNDRQSSGDADESAEANGSPYPQQQPYVAPHSSNDSYESQPQPSFETEQPQPAMAAFVGSDEADTSGLVTTPENPQPSRGRSRSGANRQKQPVQSAPVEPSNPESVSNE